jgi:hypothetical protein
MTALSLYLHMDFIIYLVMNRLRQAMPLGSWTYYFSHLVSSTCLLSLWPFSLIFHPVGNIASYAFLVSFVRFY